MFLINSQVFCFYSRQSLCGYKKTEVGRVVEVVGVSGVKSKAGRGVEDLEARR